MKALANRHSSVILSKLTRAVVSNAWRDSHFRFLFTTFTSHYYLGEALLLANLQMSELCCPVAVFLNMPRQHGSLYKDLTLRLLVS
jgi:hypothetical protein